MKLYGIIESYMDYKGADATNWGVKKTLEEAQAALKEIIEHQFHYIRENIIYEIEEEFCVKAEDSEIEERWNKWFESHLEEGSHGDDGYEYKWEYDDGDCIFKFYIDEIDFWE